MNNLFSSFIEKRNKNKKLNENDSKDQTPQVKHKRQNSLQPIQGNLIRQGLLDQSYSNHGNHSVQTTSNGGSTITNSQSNANIGNIDSFNNIFSKMIPNKAQKVVDNIMEKYENIKDIIEKNIKPNKFAISDEEIQKLTISLSDFDQYKSNIQTEYNEYQHQKQQNGTFEDHLHDMHLNKQLTSCYQKVPKFFFQDFENEEQYPFLNDIGRNVRALVQYQNQLVEYLDDVELNLFYQVYFRFNQILEMILDFDKMGKKCEENLVKVKVVKEMNANMKQTLLIGGMQIIKKKKAQERIQKTYEILTKLKEFNQNKELKLQEDPKLAQILITEQPQDSIIEDNAFDSYNSSSSSPLKSNSPDKKNPFSKLLILIFIILNKKEDIFKQTHQKKQTIKKIIFFFNKDLEQRLKHDQVKKSLNQINLFKVISKKYVQVFKREESDYYGDLLDGASKYLKENLNFKEMQKKISHNEHSIDLSSIHSYNSNLHDSSSIHYDQDDDIDESLQVFEWTFNDIPPNPSTEMQLSKLYLKASHDYELMRFEVFKNNILKDIQKFQNHIRKQFREYCIQLYKTNNLSDNKEFRQDEDDEFAFLNDINDILLIKFSQFYSKIIISFLKKTFSLFSCMKKQIIISTYQTEQTDNYWGSKIMPIVCNITSFQIEVLDNISNDLITYLQYLNTQTDANLGFKISNSNEIFSYWLNEFPKAFQKATELDFSSTPQISQQIQQELTKANKDTIQTFDKNYFYKQKSELQFELFLSFDEKQQIILENSLSNDNWNPTNISYKIYSLLDYFFISKASQNQNQQREIFIQLDKNTFNNIENIVFYIQFGLIKDNLNSILKSIQNQILLKQQKDKVEFANQSDDEEQEELKINKIRSNIIKSDSEEEEDDLQDLNHYYIKKFERDYKIQLNKLIFEKENKRYMFSEGFLIFLKQVQKYIGIMSESKIEYSREYLNKLLSLIRFYNSFSRDFIVMAKGKNQIYPQMNGKVTVKNLATSSLNLTFLLKIFDKIGERLVQHAGFSQDLVNQELQKINVEIQNHISEIFGTIPNIIKDMLQKSAAQINNLGWHKPQEKINVPLAQTARVIDSIRSMFNVLDEILNTSDMKYIFEIILNDFTENYVYQFIQLSQSPDSNRLSVQRIKDEVIYFTNEILDISIIQLLPNVDLFANSVEQIVPLSKVPRFEEIKNKQKNNENEQEEVLQYKEQGGDVNGDDKNEMLRIAKKFSSLQSNDEDQVKNKIS